MADAARVHAAYRASQRLDERPIAVLVALHDQISHAMASAISAHDAGALDQTCRHAARATHLLGGVLAALNPCDDETFELRAFYGALRSALNRLLSDKSAMERLRRGLDRLNSMSVMLRSEMNR